MASRIRTYKRKQTPDSSTTPAQPVFQSRPFVVQPQKAETPHEQPDLKTALMRAERYGHNLNKILLTNFSIPPTGIQPKFIQQQSPVLAALSRQQVQRREEKAAVQAKAELIEVQRQAAAPEEQEETPVQSQVATNSIQRQASDS